MLGVALVAVSFLYGRLWCGWVCPQTLASDFADSLRSASGQGVSDTAPASRAFALSRALWTVLSCHVTGNGRDSGLLLARAADGLAATAAPWRDFRPGMTVYGLRGRPRRRYALAAPAVLHPRLPLRRADGRCWPTKTRWPCAIWTSATDECIRCHKCETDCPMGIDIKTGRRPARLHRLRRVRGLVQRRAGQARQARLDRVPLRCRARAGDPDAEPGRSAWACGTPAAGPLPPLFRFAWASSLFLIYGRLAADGQRHRAAAETVRERADVRNGYLLTVGNGTPRRHDLYPGCFRPAGAARIEPSPVIVPAHESRTVPVTVTGPPRR